jgi:DNA-binding CsgD family transcriptional regulator
MLKGQVPSSGIVGRDVERRTVAEFLDDVPSRLTALAIEGEPGIGKSIIWRDGCARARSRGYRVLCTQPAEAETAMSFAGLADLLEPVVDELLPELPAVSGRALEAALLRVDPSGSPGEEREVSVAFLKLARLLTARSPFLLALDDLQWLDRPSARVLEFALRRLPDAPIGVLAALRLGGGRPSVDLRRSVGPDRCRQLRIGPLDTASLRQLLETAQGIAPPRAILRRIHQLSGGNPFFALELAQALAVRDEPLGPGESLPLSETVSDLIAKRLQPLPSATREALLVASALAQPTISLLNAFRSDSNASRLLAPAESDALVEISRGRIRFSHPLIASTVYAEATAFDRQRIHLRLAGIAPDPEQRGRHLALASEGKRDEEVAAALDEAAEVADARGAPDAAAELCELARERTPGDRPLMALRRGLAAADHHFAAGEWERARFLAGEVTASEASGSELARALHLLAKLRYFGDSFPEAAQLLREALEHAGEEAEIRAPIELDLAYVTQTLEGFSTAAGHARAALLHAESLDRPGLLAEAAATVVLEDFFAGAGLDRELLQRALDLEDRTRRVAVGLRPSLVAGLVLAWTGEVDAACETFEDLRSWLIERGEEAQLPMMAGIGFVLADCWRGNLRAAAEHAREALDAARQLDSEASAALALCALATANAYLGNAEETREQARQSVELFRQVGWQVATVFPFTALALLHLSLGEPAEADRLLRPLLSLLEKAGGLSDPSSASLFLANEIEALTGVGELPPAQSLLEPLETRARQVGWPIAVAVAGRCRGLLLAARGEHEEALTALEEALVQHERVHHPVEMARTLLVQGQVERRANRRRAAEATLGRALAIFEEVGAARWAERTRGELARLGLRRAGGEELTPSEQRVAEHAGSGMTNREIAAALFISPKTVEANLTRIYRKLEIGSRAELGRRMAEREGSLAGEG